MSSTQHRVSSYARRTVWWVITLLSVFFTIAHASEPMDCLIEPHVLVDVSSSEIGVLSSVIVDEADVVRHGETVAALQTDVERATFDVTRARAQASSEIKLLRRDYEYNARKRDRVDELNKQKVVSAQDVEEVRLAQDAAWLRLQAAVETQSTAKLEATRDELALARRTILSPIDGVVVRKYKSVGEFVDGDPIVQLAQLDPLRISVVLPISMFGKIHVGMQASIVPELPVEGPFVALVTSIDPMMDAATATLGVRLSLPNPEHRLPPGLRCTLVMHPKENTDTDAQPDVKTVKTAKTIFPDTLSSTENPPSLGAATAPESCVTLGPLQGDAVVDTVSAVLNAGKVRFVRRHSTEEIKPDVVSALWLDIAENSNDRMHTALIISIREHYPELLVLPIECPQDAASQ